MQIQKYTFEIAFNQLSHSFAENFAMRSFEAENNTCASLSFARDLVRSEETHVSAKSNCEEHGCERAIEMQTFVADCFSSQ